MEKMVIGISGSSGIIMGLKAIRQVVKAGYEVELIVSKNAFIVAAQELGSEFSTLNKMMTFFSPEEQQHIQAHAFQDFCASVASGSFITKAMLIIPCSMSTLAGIACGLGDNLLKRAADVCLKEKRPLVIVPRETPFSTLHLENMLKLSQMGVSIVPPVPSWYNGSHTLEDVEDFVVGRALDQIGIHTESYARWV